MDDPKKLFCQHAFCYKCLKDYAKTCTELICPVCRLKEKISDVDKLPSALTEKQLIDVVMKYRLKKCAEDSHDPISLSDDRKEELVKHLLKGINSSNGIYKVSDKNTDLSGDPLEDSVHNTPYLWNSCTESTSSLAFIKIDIETIQENMLKYSKYKVVTGNAVQKLYKHLYQKKSENIQLNLSVFDINISSNNPSRLNEFVLMDDNSYKLIVYTESQFRTFHVCIGDKIVRPEYIKIVRGNLIMSGRLETDDAMQSVFLQCDMNGQITHQSQLYSWPDPLGLPMMLGFDFNKNDKYYLCMPQTGTVSIYDTSFVECQSCCHLEENRPEYIAFSSLQNQLWISCPLNQRILILNITSGAFRLFDTEQINKSIPKMIFVTEDDKIFFLDTKGNRIIWLKRRNEYILTQKLNIPSMYRDLHMKTFQVLPFSMVAIGIDKDILIFQSKKDFSRSRRIFESCNLL